MATRLLARQSLRPRTRQPGNPYPRIRRDTGSDNGSSVVQRFWVFSSRGGLLRCVGKEHHMATHLLRILLFTLTAILIWPSPAPAQRPAVLVNPHVQGNGTAKTIQEGIGMVDPGGKVMVLPGTYNEAIVIDKGLTLEAVGGESDSVIVAPSGAPVAAVLVATSDPVTIRDLTIHFSGANGIRGDGVVDVIAERIRVRAVNPPLGAGSLVTVINNAMTGRARLAVRESFLDGALPPANSPTPPFPQVFGIRVQGDVDALFEGNVIRRTGGACISVAMRSDFGGETNADILENDLDECYPLLRAGSAHARLRGGANIDPPLDARCNWWGSAGGPSVGTDPPGSDIVVEPGATTPEFTPWASAPIAETDEIRCTGGTE